LGALEDGKIEQPVTVEIRDVGRCEAPVLLPLDESQVEDSDDPPIDQIDQNSETLASQFRLGKLKSQVIDWPYILLGHCSTSHAAATYRGDLASHVRRRWCHRPDPGGFTPGG
jgi:hypothetical protein